MISTGKCRNEFMTKRKLYPGDHGMNQMNHTNKKRFLFTREKGEKKLCSFRQADVHMLLTCCC